MAVPIALTAISLIVAVVSAGLIGVVSMAIRKEEKILTLTTGPTDNLSKVGRRLTGVHVRPPLRITLANRETTPV
jgi:protein-S-isoprenylcysteine O-methyltransferase Ste14